MREVTVTELPSSPTQPVGPGCEISLHGISAAVVIVGSQNACLKYARNVYRNCNVPNKYKYLYVEKENCIYALFV